MDLINQLSTRLVRKFEFGDAKVYTVKMYLYSPFNVSILGAINGKENGLAFCILPA